MTTQLRIYTINRGRLDEFAAAWRTGVYPLRLKHGFRIPSAWINRETNQFIWLLQYDGPDGWEAREALYYSSPERLAMNPDPAPLIARNESYIVEAVVE
jgi:hypothetical protein